MPWQTRDLMTLRREFVELALQEGANRRALCRRFGISPKTGYALLARYQAAGAAGLSDRSRRPLHSPGKTSETIEALVVALRRQHPSWGGRKICRRLQDLGHHPLPAPSTITHILHRHGLLIENADEAPLEGQRFEHAEPNALWQIDFKGHFETAAGRCHPLTLLDDHSRFNLTLQACQRTDTPTVKACLAQVFERYGLPVRINADNGAPWGSPSSGGRSLSELSIWLIRHGIRISHSRPYHPQTNGKAERFHRSFKAELLAGRSFENLALAQVAFDRWRTVYNCERPHEALGLDTPVRRYRPSNRPYSASLAPIEYGPDDQVVVVGWDGKVMFKGRRLRVSNALHRLPVAFRPVGSEDGVYDLFFCHHHLERIDWRDL